MPPITPNKGVYSSPPPPPPPPGTPQTHGGLLCVGDMGTPRPEGGGGGAAHCSEAEAPPCLPAWSSRARFDIFKSRYFKKSIQQRSTTCPPHLPPPHPPASIPDCSTGGWGEHSSYGQPGKGSSPSPKGVALPKKALLPHPQVQLPTPLHPNAILPPPRCSSPLPPPCIQILTQAPSPPTQGAAQPSVAPLGAAVRDAARRGGQCGGAAVSPDGQLGREGLKHLPLPHISGIP